jgi:hypothetical protein
MVRQTTLDNPKPKVEEPVQVFTRTRLRKRQINSNCNDERRLERAPLTRKNLSLFNKMGRKKSPNDNGPQSTLRESADGPSATKTVSTMSSGFDVRAYENGILDPVNSNPPTNLNAIRQRLARSRVTASPRGSECNCYINIVRTTPNEATMVDEVVGWMLKRYDDIGYNRMFNRPLSGFPEHVGFNNGLCVPRPDFVEGLRLQNFRPFPVGKHVSGAVLYKDDRYSTTLQNISGEWKVGGKNMKEAMLQSAYDGAALVYARNQALLYLGESDPLAIQRS